MNIYRSFYYLKQLALNITSLKGLSSLLSSFGALWLCIVISDRFFKDTQLPTLIQNYRWVFFLSGGLIALYICRPILRVTEKLKDHDVAISIAIGNIFSFEGAVIVGSNTTFDTHISRNLISEKSVQGQFTKQYYGDAILLDKELDAELNGTPCEELPRRRVGKTKRYPIGQVVRLNPKKRTGYFVAIANINEHGVAEGTFEDLLQSLGQLWVFIGQRGLKEPLVIPVLGSGFTRLKQGRQLIMQEIIKSFIAACSEKTFCENLTIVLNGDDVLKHQIDFVALGNYLNHVCLYADFAMNNSDRIGTAAN